MHKCDTCTKKGKCKLDHVYCGSRYDATPARRAEQAKTRNFQNPHVRSAGVKIKNGQVDISTMLT